MLTFSSFRPAEVHACFSCLPRLLAAQGCIELLDRSGVEISGKQAVVIGRSNIVGMPAAMLLMKRNATVTIVHSGAGAEVVVALTMRTPSLPYRELPLPAYLPACM